jgi:hypothetical protein
MKNLKPFAITTVLLFSITTIPLQAEPIQKDAPSMEHPSAEAQVIFNRLDEIKAMDKSDMSFSEKKALRKEVRSSEKALSTMDGGVYISVGAIIIIILLLIILL